MSFYRQEIGYTSRDRWVWRNRWLRKPIHVQQVEVKVREDYSTGRSIECDTFTVWRDMRIEDVGLWRTAEKE